ncbi:ubiquitin-conjugating enzyme/RWD-like protein [Amylocarpus encephaloides]|uniref:Ubiquitin-conjugating enzyme/RWD-like protein n=1 Tax=Amylocarpus encephaloides TaxID=45428 RepID=A0A9P7YEV8_9HELO|nr:ubiquitin-conjugating enzyme/RWD-like protein [Amylocarpus encephaloides]
MASPRFNSKSPTIKRILKEAAEINQSPSADYHASPATDSDLFQWHFTLRGPPSSAFSNGIYHGRIVLPPTYPLRPPSFRFLTPSGRFEANREICLSISGHHEESWQPAWGIRTALVALRSFMETDAKGQLGGLECSAKERERIAGGSGGWKCGICGKSNREILAECEEAVREKEKEGEQVAEVEIPSELKMGYKDEIENAKGKEKATNETTTEAVLAEGFVQTTMDGASDAPLVPLPQTSSGYLAARPAQTVPQPTGRVAIGSQTIHQPPQPRDQATTHSTTPTQAQLPTRRSNDGVPMWIDRAIAGVVILLVAMVMKILLGM